MLFIYNLLKQFLKLPKHIPTSTTKGIFSKCITPPADQYQTTTTTTTNKAHEEKRKHGPIKEQNKFPQNDSKEMEVYKLPTKNSKH